MSWRRWWPLLRRVLLLAFLAAVGLLLWRQARAVDWQAVQQSFSDMPWWTLGAAAALSALSHAVYSSYDLLARRQVGHALPARSVLAVTFVSYAFNLNMGALVGGAGFRFRLYSQLGLGPGKISRVLAFSLLTNWSGYCVLLGAVLLAQLVPLPAGWELGALATRWLGVGVLALPLAYVALCALSPRRTFSLRDREFTLPTVGMALLQLSLSVANWAIIGAIVWLLLGPGAVAYPLVLGVLLLAAIAGAVAHIPAGLGVLEAVFVLSLGAALGKPAIIASLLAYRALYYLAPLLVATAVYLALEWRTRQHQRGYAGDAPSATRSEARGPIIRA